MKYLIFALTLAPWLSYEDGDWLDSLVAVAIITGIFGLLDHFVWEYIRDRRRRRKRERKASKA